MIPEIHHAYVTEMAEAEVETAFNSQQESSSEDYLLLSVMLQKRFCNQCLF